MMMVKLNELKCDVVIYHHFDTGVFGEVLHFLLQMYPNLFAYMLQCFKLTVIICFR